MWVSRVAPFLGWIEILLNRSMKPGVRGVVQLVGAAWDWECGWSVRVDGPERTQPRD